MEEKKEIKNFQNEEEKKKPEEKEKEDINAYFNPKPSK